MNTQLEPRSLYLIASEIRCTWPKVNYAALLAADKVSLDVAAIGPHTPALLRAAKRIDAKLQAARESNQEPNF